MGGPWGPRATGAGMVQATVVATHGAKHLGLVESFGYFDDDFPLVVSVECFPLVVSMES